LENKSERVKRYFNDKAMYSIGGKLDQNKLKLAHEELKKLRKPIYNVNVRHKESLRVLEKIAVTVTDYVGSMGFFLVIFTWTLLWLGWNTIAPNALSFDAFPAFVLWLLISNVIQILLMPLIMVGQNLQGRHAEQRAESDFDVNVRAEKEIKVILMHLEQQNELILKILHNIEKVDIKK
jgi:uncharacterized membrane protein